MSVKLTVDLSGPLFTRDPKKTIRTNIRRMLLGLAGEGARLVTSVFPRRTGAGIGGVRGRVASLAGKAWFYHATISQTHVYRWPRGGAKQYRGGKLERKRGMFRRATGALRSSRAVIGANLTEGLE